MVWFLFTNSIGFVSWVAPALTWKSMRGLISVKSSTQKSFLGHILKIRYAISSNTKSLFENLAIIILGIRMIQNTVSDIWIFLKHILIELLILRLLQTTFSVLFGIIALFLLRTFHIFHVKIALGYLFCHMPIILLRPIILI